MAKYVIAGKSSCPFYARAELLADELKLRLPAFSVHKIVVNPEEWNSWVANTCQKNGWTYNGASPMVWRELINRGGKGVLLGGCNEFLEMAKGYYGITCEKLTEELKLIGTENESTKQLDDQLAAETAESKNPYRMAVTNATCSLAYHVLPQLLRNASFEPYSEVLISLYSQKSDECDALRGVCMELQDCAYGSVSQVNPVTSFQSACQDADLVIVLESADVRTLKDDPEIERKHFSSIRSYGETIQVAAKKTAKIFVAGTTAIQDCFILSKYAEDLPRENFFALTRFLENKVKAQVAKKLAVKTSDVKNVIIWGDPSDELVIDLSLSEVTGYNGCVWGPHINTFSHTVNDVIYDKTFVSSELPQAVSSKQISDTEAPVAREILSLSAAFESQICELLSPVDETSSTFSLGLLSSGWYGVPEGLVFSFPVKMTADGVKVQDLLKLESNIQESLDKASKVVQENSERIIQLLS